MIRKNKIRIILTVITIITVLANVALAAPGASELQRIRSSQKPDKVRIVLDLSALPKYTVTYMPDLSYIQIDLPNTVDKGALPQLLFNDSHVAAVRIMELEPGLQRIYIDLKAAIAYNVFTLSNPSRLVIDISRQFEQKVVSELEPGITHTYWLRGRGTGPVTANIIKVDMSKGYTLQPMLSNGAVQGLESLAAMSEKAKAIAAVNGSYFAPTGQILGLLKIDGEIISTPSLPRTALGVKAGGEIMIDQVGYSGAAILPGNKVVEISGVNCERGNNELVLYTGYFGGTTQTNSFGSEYTVSGGKVTAINAGNSLIAPGAVVLSAHGDSAKAMAGLAVGDPVEIKQTLGEWDKTTQAIGAGPTLVKGGSIFITTKIEDFGSDVSGGRAPRTAVGLTKDNQLLLVTVDGRQSHSAGLNLLELALFMQELGAVEAMNLDGGGSTEMVIYDKVINKPSDGRERRLGSGLAVVRAKLAN